MPTLHWSPRPQSPVAFRQTTVISGRLLGDETPVETELTREGDDYEILGDVLRRFTVPPPPRVRSTGHAPILPPARRSLATR